MYDRYLAADASTSSAFALIAPWNTNAGRYTIPTRFAVCWNGLSSSLIEYRLAPPAWYASAPPPVEIAESHSFPRSATPPGSGRD